MIRTWALLGVLISGALIDGARGSDLVECEPQRVTDDGRHWAYRILDGRECWYPGRPRKPKNELYWVRGTTPSAPQMDQPGTETVPSEPPSRLADAPPEKPEIAEAMPAEWRATAADKLLAFTCCWPELEKPALLPQPTLKEASRRLGRWPCYRSGSTRCGGLPSQDEHYGLFVPEMLAE